MISGISCVHFASEFMTSGLGRSELLFEGARALSLNHEHGQKINIVGFVSLDSHVSVESSWTNIEDLSLRDLKTGRVFMPVHFDKLNVGSEILEGRVVYLIAQNGILWTAKAAEVIDFLKSRS